MWSKQWWSICSARVGTCVERVRETHSHRSSPLITSPPCLRGKPAHELHRSRVQASHRPPVSPNHLPTSHGGLSPPCRTPGLGHQICGCRCSLPRAGIYLNSLLFPSKSPPRDTGPNLITCIPSLQFWVYRHLFDSFQLISSENYSTCRCIFFVFMRGGEFRVLCSTISSLASGFGVIA